MHDREYFCNLKPLLFATASFALSIAARKSMTSHYPHLRTLWAPNILYEAGNPRQRVPLDLYVPAEASTSGERRRAREKRDAQAKYAARRDLMNVLSGKTTRMAWDYQAEAASLSDDEREYEAQVSWYDELVIGQAADTQRSWILCGIMAMSG